MMIHYTGPVNPQLRATGLSAVESIPWGTHLCHLFQTRDDLSEILVPFFAEGLRSNEQCIWVTSPPFEATEAYAALRQEVGDLDERVRNGQIEIFGHREWYIRSGKMTA